MISQWKNPSAKVRHESLAPFRALPGRSRPSRIRAIFRPSGARAQFYSHLQRAPRACFRMAKVVTCVVQRVIDGCEAEKKQPLKICAQSMCLAVETKSIAWFFRPCQDMPSHQTTHVVPCFSNVRRVPVRVRGEFFSISFL